MREISRGCTGTDVDSVIGRLAGSSLMDEIELLDGASAEFDQELVQAGRAVTGILRIRSDQLRCGDLSAAFP